MLVPTVLRRLHVPPAREQILVGEMSLPRLEEFLLGHRFPSPRVIALPHGLQFGPASIETCLREFRCPSAFELLLVDEGLQDLIAEDRHKTILRRYVMGNGFSTMVDDAVEKVSAGVTSLDEITRVLPFRQLVLARQTRVGLSRTEQAVEDA